MPDYLGQLDDLFTGLTVDGSTTYRPGTGATIDAIGVDDSDDEDAQHERQEDVATPARPGSRGWAGSATAAGPQS